MTPIEHKCARCGRTFEDDEECLIHNEDHTRCLCDDCAPTAEARKVLIIGTGRCGTHYLSRILRRIGCEVPHERIGHDGGIGWFFATDTPWNDHDRSRFAFGQIWTVTREPLATISSQHTHVRKMWKFIGRVQNWTFPKNKTLRAAWHYVKWNTLCLDQSDWHFRVEDIHRDSAVYREMRSRLGLRRRKCPILPTDINTRKHRRSYKSVTLDDLRALGDAELISALRDVSARCGYVLND